MNNNVNTGASQVRIKREKKALIDGNKIKAWVFDQRVKRKIKKANKLQELTKNKFYVMILGGKVRIYRKKDLRLLVKKRVFKVKSIEELEKHAIHVTTT